MSIKEIGRGDNSSSRLKQLLIESDSNTVSDGEYTITYSGDSIFDQSYKAVGKLYKNISFEDCCWTSYDWKHNAHEWKVDLGRVVNNICKFSFNVTDYKTGVPSVKFYHVEITDGNKQTEIKDDWYFKYTPEEPKETFSNRITTWKPVIINFDPPISLRCFTLGLNSNLSSNLVSIGNCLLYAQDDSIQDISNKQFFLKESDNNIYDNILSEKISTLDNWKRLNKQEKLNLLGTSCKPGVLDYNKKLKSFGSFKILSSEDL